MGVGKGQGYLFSKPLAAADLAVYLTSAMAEAPAAAVVALPTRRRSD